MTRKRWRYGTSIITSCATALLSTGVVAQQPKEQGMLDEVVVTGTNIRGTKEDGALPVDVISAEDLVKSGSPSVVDFMKSLSTQGDTAGQNGYLAGLPDIANFNLRGLGAGRTLTLLNSRRTDENVNMLPSISLSRIEILKDGAAALYGADAAGGVVNYITLPNFEGFKAKADFTHIPDAEDGKDYNIGLMWGAGTDHINFYVSVEWEHRSELNATDRDWRIVPYERNPTAGAPYNNPGVFREATIDPITGAYTPTAGNGALIADFTEGSCEAIGGTQISSAASPVAGVCNFNFADWTSIVPKQDIVRSYAQLSGDIGEKSKFQFSILHSTSKTPESRQSPVYGTSRGPGGPSLARGSANQFTVPNNNPYLDEFYQQNRGTAVPANTGLVAVLWLPYGLSGNLAPGFSAANGAAISKYDRETLQVMAQFDGTFDDSFATPVLGSEISWNASVSLRKYDTHRTEPAEIGFRVQQALNGFGGPNCNAPDQVAYVSGNYATIGTQNPTAAGVGNCMFLNPFASGFARNSNLDLANPRYIPGTENPAILNDWIFDAREQFSTLNVGQLDLILSGKTPLVLPGGNMGWALGGQFYESKDSFNFNSNYAKTGGSNPCAYPEQNVGDTGCPAEEGAYWLLSPVAEFNDRKTESRSAYAELHLPVLDNLSFQLAGRHEDYATGVEATVWKISTKYDMTDWLGFRASAGTNFAAVPATTIPGTTTSVVQSVTKANSRYLGVDQTVGSSLVPEEAFVYNIGAIFAFDGFTSGSRFVTTFDYFNIEINDEIATVNANAIANQVISRDAAGAFLATGTYADCSHVLANRITFVTGPCVQGTTLGSDIERIRTVTTNRQGLSTSGIDFSSDYSMPLMSGDFIVGVSGTYLLEYKMAPFLYEGIVFEAATDGLGYLNAGTSLNQGTKLRGNLHTGYIIGDHSIYFDIRYVQGVTDRRPPPTVPALVGGALPSPLPLASDGMEVDDYITAHLTYIYQVTDNLAVTGHIRNITNEDPPYARTNANYNQLQADAYGRTFKIGAEFKFK